MDHDGSINARRRSLWTESIRQMHTYLLTGRPPSTPTTTRPPTPRQYETKRHSQTAQHGTRPTLDTPTRLPRSRLQVPYYLSHSEPLWARASFLLVPVMFDRSVIKLPTYLPTSLHTYALHVSLRTPAASPGDSTSGRAQTTCTNLPSK